MVGPHPDDAVRTSRCAILHRWGVIQPGATDQGNRHRPVATHQTKLCRPRITGDLSPRRRLPDRLCAGSSRQHARLVPVARWAFGVPGGQSYMPSRTAENTSRTAYVRGFLLLARCASPLRCAVGRDGSADNKTSTAIDGRRSQGLFAD
jgi:hypothetical protein